MVKGIGTDIIQIQRIQASLERTGDRLLTRILTETERAVFQEKHACAPVTALNFFAKRFAAKEAVGKALGSGIGQGVSWQDIEISNDAIGAPCVCLKGEAHKRMLALGAGHCHLSLSDEQDYAVAFVVIS